MFVCFEGVRDPESLLTILFRITSEDIQCAPGIIGVHVEDVSDAERILNDPDMAELDDTPYGYWSADIMDEDGFLDKVEGSYHLRRRSFSGGF